MAETKIKLLYTPEEWNILEEICQGTHGNNVRDFLHSRMHIMANNCRPIHKKESVPKTPNNYIVPEDICGELMRFARHRNISLAKLICWYNIDPLIKQYYDQKIKHPQ